MRKSVLLTATIILSFYASLIAQVINITGQVRDEKGNGLIGVTINEKNTRNFTTTDEKGNFTFKVNPNAKIFISYVGFESQEVAAKTNLQITLLTETQALGEVVVTGVGVATSKKKLSIDVASLSSKDFAKSATTSIEQALTGQIAGAQIQQTSGQPGSGFSIILRGINSLGSTAPLIMVDGVEVKDLTSLDPSVVDRIEVVKGAVGGTLYGAQGANGVIQIFTKRGVRNGKLSISFNSKVSVDNILKGKTPILSSHHHYVTDASGNILDASGNPIKADATGQWPDPAVPDPTVNPNLTNDKTFNIPTYDHLKQAFRQALTFSNAVLASGGGAYSDYSFAASSLKQQDVFSNKFNRTNFSINLGFEPLKGFTFRSITQFVSTYEDLLNGNRFEVLDAYPWVNLNWLDSTGKRALKTSAASNQLNSLSERDWHMRNSKTIALVQNFIFNYKINRFVELDLKYGFNLKNIDTYDYYQNQSAALQSSLHWGSDRQGSITDGYSSEQFQNLLSSIYIRTDFEKDFRINVPIKTSTQVSYDWRNDNFRSYFSEGIQLPTYPPANISVANVKNSGDNSTEFTTFGVLINQSIDFGNLFGITGGIRSDYSAEFGAASKPFTFPRGTAYFRLSELFQNHSFLSDWKIRGAYGEAGIQPMRYQRQVTFDVNTLGNGVSLSLPTTAENPNLRVQNSKETELGTDAAFNLLKNNWLNKLSLSVTYWNRTSSDIIQPANVAPSTGFADLVDNLTTLTSKGVDISVDITAYASRNITWTSGIRWGVTQSKISKIANGADVILGQFALKQGQSLGLFYGQTPLHSLTQTNPAGAPYIPQGQQGNYTIAQGNVVNTATNSVVLTASNDQSVIGKAYPDFTSSWINTIRIYNSLTVSFQFDWVHGNNIYNTTRQWLYSPAGGSGGSGGISHDFDNAVTINGKTGTFVNYYQSLYNLVSPTSWFVEDGSFVRLRDLSVSYELSNILKLSWLKRLTATLSGRNLLTFTKYRGLDPENTSAVDGQGNQITAVGAFKGVDFFGIPNLKSYQFSLNVGF
ncbi:MAG TPA: SusC/RagA family TonB-linked outer membrane protein [Puia sp.]|jgi:TonB-linked SusC/RagA family outer membrane protein|nr:SusC/RagA family TonB-linked outer membrane protein [Puia sp.]